MAMQNNKSSLFLNDLLSVLPDREPFTIREACNNYQTKLKRNFKKDFGVSKIEKVFTSHPGIFDVIGKEKGDRRKVKIICNTDPTAAAATAAIATANPSQVPQSPSPPAETKESSQIAHNNITFNDVKCQTQTSTKSAELFPDYFLKNTVCGENESKIHPILEGEQRNKICTGGYSKSRINLFGEIKRDIMSDLEGKQHDRNTEEEPQELQPQSLVMNVSDPFCMVFVGVQGAGKSHSMNVALENCLLNPVAPISSSSKEQNMCGLVFHFDQDGCNVCESIGLSEVDPNLPESNQCPQAVNNTIILASPTYYSIRKNFYGRNREDNTFNVVPLYFNWQRLTADQIKKLMRVHSDGNQLYMSTLLNLLRQYQKEGGKIPSFSQFVKDVEKACNLQGQGGALKQRLDLLRAFVCDEKGNEAVDIAELVNRDTLIVADLTDPLLSGDEASNVFHVLLDQFRSAGDRKLGKVVAFDEAHKYFSVQSEGRDDLASSVVDAARKMRHENIRILVSTQSPKTLPPELLELTSATVVHRFQSMDWFDYLKKKVPMPDDGFERAKKLDKGECLVLSSKIPLVGVNVSWTLMTTRRRITSDYGASKTA